MPSSRLACSNAQRTREESFIQVVGMVVVVYPCRPAGYTAAFVCGRGGHFLFSSLNLLEQNL